MNKNVYVMNSPELPTPGTHNYTITKFSTGFKFHGYNVKEVKTLDSMTDGSIVILSDHGIYANNMWALNVLAEKYPNSVFICWFYHKFYNQIPFKKFIITGEHFHKKPIKAEHIFCWDLQHKINNYVPLTFSSPLLPEIVGTLPRNESINGCFIGTRYKQEWIQELSNIKYITNNKLPENERINIFLQSKIAFGFHDPANITNNVVVERVFEGMAFGCVVISDNLVAGEITNNIVQVASNKNEFLNIYNRLLNNDKERLVLQKRGYEWIKNNGLYVHVAENFINKMEELKYA